VLRSSRVWRAIFEAWLEGSSLAGSSAGAMAMGSHSLIRATWPNRFNRRPTEGLGLVPEVAVLPHFETFGHRWVESAEKELPGATLLGVDERSAAVWTKDEWLACGPGSVTVIKGSKASPYPAGSKILGLAAPLRMLPQE
jgi:cyanophycinase